MHRPTLLSLACASALACAFPLPAFAQDDADALDRVVVTATRTARTVDDTLAAVEVIDADQIARSQARSLPDLLRGRAGLSVSNQGGQGKLTTVFMRGAESDHVLVLVDGVRAGSATSGLVAFQDLPVDLIERVEIVRGPRSSLYGSEAIGGVIQVFTRRDRGGIAPRAHVGGGSHDTREAGAGIGGGDAARWFSADYAWRRTEGINACRGIGFPVFAGCFTTEPDRDGYESNALSLRGGLALGAAWTLDATALVNKGSNEYDGSFGNQSETWQRVFGANATWTAGERLNVRLSAGRNSDTSDNFKDGVSTGYFDTDRDSAGAQADIVLADGHLLTVGADWLRDRVDSDVDYTDIDTARTVESRANRAAFVQLQSSVGAFDLQAAARNDDNDQFGNHSTGNIALGWDFAQGWRATAGVGTAFKAPTFNELYYPFFGNPDLDPERSRTVEAGVAWRGDGMGLRLDAFDTRVEDLIAYDAAIFLPNNLQAARLRGAELTGNATLAGWSLAGSASVLDPENRAAGAAFGNDLPRRARRSARVELDRAFGAFRLGVTGVAEGARFDDVANTRRSGGYATFDLRAEYAFNADWRLQGRVANVFDRDYETSAYYHQPGREWFVTLRYAPVR